MKNSKLEKVIPEYPRTHHVPFKANAKRDDLICTLDECKSLWTQNVAIQEKIDGSQCRMTIFEDQPVIGNRNHILNKAYSREKVRTTSKMQFSMVFGWWYANKSLFESLAKVGPYSVYGDWMYMQHGMHYDLLPSYFMTYDVYDYEVGKFLDTKLADTILVDCGFSVVPLLHYGPVENFKQLEEMANETTQFATESKREGVYLKVSDGSYVVDRFKMVRDGFEQGKYLSQTSLLRNKIT